MRTREAVGTLRLPRADGRIGVRVPLDDRDAGRAFGHLREAARAAGAGAVRDVRVEARLTDGDACLGTIHADRLGAWILTPIAEAASAPLPADELMLELLRRLIVAWGLSHARLAEALGCAEHVLGLWLSVPGRFRLPATVLVRINRLVLVDRLRIELGVAEGEVGAWLEGARPDLGGRSIAESLLDRDQDGFRLALGALCTSMTSTGGPSRLLH